MEKTEFLIPIQEIHIYIQEVAFLGRKNKLKGVLTMVVINFSLENISGVGQLPLHDAELLNIFCDYSNYVVKIKLKLDSPGKKNIETEMILLGVKLLNVPIDEPWGTGKYINEVTCCSKKTNSENCLFDLKIRLNSGDEILVTAKDLVYHEK